MTKCNCRQIPCACSPDYHQRFRDFFCNRPLIIKDAPEKLRDRDQTSEILAFIDEVVAEREAWWTDRMLREVERIAQITENKERALLIDEVNKRTSRLADCNKDEVSYSARETGLCPSGYWNFGGKGCHDQNCKHCSPKETECCEKCLKVGAAKLGGASFRCYDRECPCHKRKEVCPARRGGFCEEDLCGECYYCDRNMLKESP